MSLFSSAFDNGPGLGGGPSSIPLGAPSIPSRAIHGAPSRATSGQRSMKGKSARPNGPRNAGHQPHANGSRSAVGMSDKREKTERKTKKDNKRRRNESSPDDRLGSTQRNMEQIMSRLEAAVPKDRGDSRPMGMPSKQKKRKGDGDHVKRSALRSGTQEKNSKGKRRKDESFGSHGDLSKDKGLANAQVAKSPQLGRSGLQPVPAEPESEDEAGADGLTKMQKGMRTKLEEARFRWINEQLYSNSSKEAVAMMKEDPKVFSDYHSTHRVLTSGWPTPPLPYILEKLRPLPPKTVIVDLGCGDASLARSLVPEGKIVLSYDLVGDSGVAESSKSGNGGWVVEADFLDRVPLPGRPSDQYSDVNGFDFIEDMEREGAEREIVDVVVCCLSLMGTNWVGGVYEACRILKRGGVLHIAEVTSRIVLTDRFVKMIESIGFELEDQDSPSTHFTLFEFTKTTDTPMGPVKGEPGWQERVVEGQSIMKGCVYKKR